jgi:hypothetical protein
MRNIALAVVLRKYPQTTHSLSHITITPASMFIGVNCDATTGDLVSPFHSQFGKLVSYVTMDANA